MSGVVFFFKQKTAYDMRISDWSSDVCSSDLAVLMTAIGSWPATHAAEPAVEADVPVPQAEFLLLGSYHMNNPGRDVHNTRADDVLSEQRQKEIAEVVSLDRKSVV